MKVMSERHFPDAKFSLYFLGSSNIPDNVECKDLFQPVLELTHNHGTESDDSFKHNNGNEEGKQGFGHIGFLVDDVYAACDAIRAMGYGFRKVRLITSSSSVSISSVDSRRSPLHRFLPLLYCLSTGRSLMAVP